MSRVPYYILYNRYTNELSAFQNVAGHYQALELTEPRLWLADAELGLGLWQGNYEEISAQWLRWYDPKIMGLKPLPLVSPVIYKISSK